MPLEERFSAAASAAAAATPSATTGALWYSCADSCASRASAASSSLRAAPAVSAASTSAMVWSDAQPAALRTSSLSVSGEPDAATTHPSVVASELERRARCESRSSDSARRSKRVSCSRSSSVTRRSCSSRSSRIAFASTYEVTRICASCVSTSSARALSICSFAVVWRKALLQLSSSTWVCESWETIFLASFVTSPDFTADVKIARSTVRTMPSASAFAATTGAEGADLLFSSSATAILPITVSNDAL
mmetsp:Transcript_26239/g.50996  ORF Transcript_26239/g.50996 Transcript_26239/m.50996 type:complete len:249 (+) Transcript_26239:580-1326(+)